MPTSTSIIRQKPAQPDPRSPQRRDEEWAGGQMPGTRSDDSVDEITEEMEMYQGSGDEAEELNVAEQVNQAERNRHFDAE